MEDEDEGLSSHDAGCEFLCWGCGEFGQHCHGTSSDVSFTDSRVASLSPTDPRHQVRLAASGSSHNIAVTNSNEILVWGNGNSGQLGCNGNDTLLEPTRLTLPSEHAALTPVKGVACGGRHTMLWLENGHVYAFGNNFYAQLGYNFKEINYKENKPCPTMLQFLIYRPVMKVSCGDKHTLFLFKDGTLAAMGNNVHGQIGVGTYQEAVVPNFNISVEKPVKDIACGANHNIAISDDGDVYVWGYSKGCGHRRHNVLTPELFLTHHNVVQAAGGSCHSIVLTANGNVYTWGSGVDGELGHGQSIMFLHRPRRLTDSDLQGCVVKIACGEEFSAAVTNSGKLYMWGKNSHTISAGQRSSYSVAYPQCMNETGWPRIKYIFCGAWHAAAVTGTSDWCPAGYESECNSSEEDQEEVLSIVSKSMASEADHMEIKDENFAENEFGDFETLTMPVPVCDHQSIVLDRNMTKLTIAEFYAPSPSPVKNMGGHTVSKKVSSVSDADRVTTAASPDKRSSAGSRSLVVQMPASVLDSDSSSQSSKSAKNPDDDCNESQPDVRKTQSAQSKTFCSCSCSVRTNSRLMLKKESLKLGSGLSRSKTLMSNREYQRTVQLSKKSASSYVPPRENTFVSSTSFKFVSAEDLLTTAPAGHRGSGAGETGENSLIEKQKDRMVGILKHSKQINGIHSPARTHYLARRSKTSMVPPGHFLRGDNSRIFNKLKTSAQRSAMTSQSVVEFASQKTHGVTSRTNPQFVQESSGHPGLEKTFSTLHQRAHTDLSSANRMLLNGSQKEQTLFAENLKRKQRPIFSSASSWRNKRDLETLSVTSLPSCLSPLASNSPNTVASTPSNRSPIVKNMPRTNSDKDRCLGSEKHMSGKGPCSADVNGHMTSSEMSVSSNAHLKSSSASRRGLARNPHKILGTAIIHPRPKNFPGQIGDEHPSVHQIKDGV